MERKIVMLDVDALSPHVLHGEIYGDPGDNKEELDELFTDIKANGMLQPLVVDQLNQVISGSRRLVVAKMLGMTQVPAEHMSFTNEAQRITWMISQNAYRIKTTASRIKEAQYVEAMYAEYARAKQQHRKIDDDEVIEGIARSDGKIVARDEAGKAVGFSARTFADGKAALVTADKLRAEGKKEDAEAIEEKLETSVSGAKSLADDLSGKKETPKKSPHDLLYWYIPDLEQIVSVIKRKTAQLRKKSNSTTPAALSMFIENLEGTMGTIRSWYPKHMSDCPICDGTMFVEETACTNCIQGKVGRYKMPAPPVVEESDEIEEM